MSWGRFGLGMGVKKEGEKEEMIDLQVWCLASTVDPYVTSNERPYSNTLEKGNDGIKSEKHDDADDDEDEETNVDESAPVTPTGFSQDLILCVGCIVVHEWVIGVGNEAA